MRRPAVSLAVTTAIVVCISPSASSGAARTVVADKNCSDFSTQQQAQQYFESHGGSPSNNVDGLDRDHDGVACEDLPAGGGGGGSPTPPCFSTAGAGAGHIRTSTARRVQPSLA